MIYVEWLRVRNCLRVLAIVLGIILLGVLVMRVVMSAQASYDTWVAQLQQERGTSVVRSANPDGSVHLILDNRAQNIHVVLDDYGAGGTRMVITEPRATHVKKMSMGDIDVTRHGTMQTTTVDTTQSVPILGLMIFANVISLIIATCLGTPLAREGDGHLEIALTKPVSRERFALGVIGADVAGIAASVVMAIVAAMIAVAFFGVPRFDFSGVNWQALVMGIVLPVSWYALLCAATASIKRGYGAVLGFAWPVAIVVAILGQVRVAGESILASVLLGFFWLLSRLDPLSYASFQASMAAMQTRSYSVSLNPTFDYRVSILIALIVVYMTLAVVQWQRTEAS